MTWKFAFTTSSITGEYQIDDNAWDLAQRCTISQNGKFSQIQSYYYIIGSQYVKGYSLYIKDTNSQNWIFIEGSARLRDYELKNTWDNFLNELERVRTINAYKELVNG